MKKTGNTKLITVGELVKELTGYEKKHWDWNVEITAEGVEGEEEDPTCIITGMELDKDGDLRIEIEEEWAGGGAYYVGELLEQLKDFDAGTPVYLAGGSLLFSIDDQGGIFAETDEDDDTLSCYATAFGDYEEEPSVKASEVKKTVHMDRKGAIALVAMTVVIFFGLCYNIYALAVHSIRHAVWENIGGVVLCVLLLVICGATLYYSKEK
ncbi:MAG: hypothetical protein J5639_02160 [Bacteroidales bacterium]|nr:hypothetical protein [Bacteroidales bacterium]